MKRDDLDQHILEGLIGIGYDIHIHDVSGEFPEGLSREEYENERIDELFDTESLGGCEVCGRVDGSHYSSCGYYKHR